VIDRRRLIGAAAGLLAAPHSARAQQRTAGARVGWLSLGTPQPGERIFKAFEDGLRGRGYVESRAVTIERRWANGVLERLPALAAELVRLPAQVIVAPSNPSIVAAKQATSTIPIVMVHAVSPVENGLIASLAHPGGNVTGLSIAAGDQIMGKRLQMLKEIVPALSVVAILRQAESGADLTAPEAEAAARKLGLTLVVTEIRRVDDIEAAFTKMKRARAGALVVSGGPLTFVRRQQIAKLALDHRLPAMHGLSEYVHDGLLLSYGPDLLDLYRRSAGFVDRILKGAKPADLPVEQPTRFELIINMKTAKALGLTIPQSVLVRADEVIE
jgi:putative tryptophan/tyrosine transport system substrate-binding protein